MLAYRSLCPSGWTTRWDEQRGKWRAVDTKVFADNGYRGGNLPPQTRPVDSDCVGGMQLTGLEVRLESGIGGAEHLYHIDRHRQCNSESRVYNLRARTRDLFDDEVYLRYIRADKTIPIAATALELTCCSPLCSSPDMHQLIGTNMTTASALHGSSSFLSYVFSVPHSTQLITHHMRHTVHSILAIYDYDLSHYSYCYQVTAYSKGNIQFSPIFRKPQP